MKLLKKIGILLKETFLSPTTTSIISEEGSRITVVRETKKQKSIQNDSKNNRKTQKEN